MAHIVLVTTFFHPIHGGVEQEVFDLAKALIDKGHKVTVFCSNATRTKEKIQKKTEVVDGITIKRFNVLFSISQFYKIYPGIFTALMKCDFDVVHVHCFRRFETYPALLAAKLKKKRIVLTTHNPFTACTRSKMLNFFVKLHDVTFGKLFSRFLDTVICLLEEEIPIMKSFNVSEKKIAVIPNGINEKIFKEGDEKMFFKKYNIPQKEFKHIVVWIGRLNKVKGLENLETAVKQLTNTLFLFIGPNDDASDELKQLYRECKNVIFTGPIPHEEVIHAYTAGNVYVLPSHHEPFGVVLLEAMAQGLPIIATTAGGPKEIVKKEFGITQDPHDQWAWVVNLRKLLEKPQLRRKMSLAAKEEAEKYLWSNLVNDVLNVYGL